MAFSGTLTKTTLTSYGEITKGVDADAAVDLAHGLGVVPEYADVAAVSGTEAAWRVSGLDATNVKLAASATAGTAASKCRIVAGTRHSIIK